MTPQTILDTLIRDITAAGFMAKSEARRRMEEYGKALLAEKREKIEKMKMGVGDENFANHPDAVDCWNYDRQARCVICERNINYNDALDDVLSVLSE